VGILAAYSLVPFKLYIPVLRPGVFPAYGAGAFPARMSRYFSGQRCPGVLPANGPGVLPANVPVFFRPKVPVFFRPTVPVFFRPTVPVFFRERREFSFVLQNTKKPQPRAVTGIHYNVEAPEENKGSRKYSFVPLFFPKTNE